MLLKPKNTNSKLRLYQYSQDNFQQEGIDIDIVDASTIDEPKLIYSSGELYVKYVSNNQVKVKKKTMSDSLLLFKSLLQQKLYIIKENKLI